MLSIVVLGLALTCAVAQGGLTDGQGGFGVGLPFNCPLTPPSVLKVPILQAIPSLVAAVPLPCADDCRSNHRATDGACDALGKCVCSYTYETVNNTRVPVAYSSELCTAQLCQCADRSASAAYDAVCDGDCSCNHGANYGTCDYEHRQCVCNYDQPYNGNCVVRDIDPEGFSRDAQYFYAITKQAADFRNLFNVITNFMKQNICLPAPLPLPGLTNLAGK